MCRRMLVPICAVVLGLTGCRHAAPTPAKVQEQSQVDSITRLDALLSGKGMTFIKEFHPLGNGIEGSYGGGLKLKTLTVTDAHHPDIRLHGLQVQVTPSGSYAVTQTSLLDAGEVAAFSRALADMMQLVEKWRGMDKEYTEVIFTTTSGFYVGFYQEGKKTNGCAGVGALGTNTAYFPVGRFKSIKAQADEALRLLALPLPDSQSVARSESS